MTVRQKLSFDIFLDTLYAKIFLYPLLLILRTYLSLDRYYFFVSLLTYTPLLYKIIPFLVFFSSNKKYFLDISNCIFSPSPQTIPHVVCLQRDIRKPRKRICTDQRARAHTCEPKMDYDTEYRDYGGGGQPPQKKLRDDGGENGVMEHFLHRNDDKIPPNHILLMSVTNNKYPINVEVIYKVTSIIGKVKPFNSLGSKEVPGTYLLQLSFLIEFVV